jgi:hypothetical protein
VREAGDESRRRSAVPAFREHLMHRAARQAALQHGIRLLMTKQRPARHSTAMIGLDARDAVTQTRKRPRAAPVSSHDHYPSVTMNSRRSELFMICSI